MTHNWIIRKDVNGVRATVLETLNTDKVFNDLASVARSSAVVHHSGILRGLGTEAQPSCSSADAVSGQGKRFCESH